MHAILVPMHYMITLAIGHSIFHALRVTRVVAKPSSALLGIGPDKEINGVELALIDKRGDRTAVKIVQAATGQREGSVFQEMPRYQPLDLSENPPGCLLRSLENGFASPTV